MEQAVQDHQHTMTSTLVQGGPGCCDPLSTTLPESIIKYVANRSAFSLVLKGRDGGMLCGYEHYDSDVRNVDSIYPFVHDEGSCTLNSKWRFVHVRDNLFHIVLHNPQKRARDGSDMHGWRLCAYKHYGPEKRNCASTYVCVHKPCGHGRDTWRVQGSVHDLKISLAEDTDGPNRTGWELSSVRWYDKDKRNCASEWAFIHAVNKHSSGNRWQLMHGVSL